jgi:hypothetical protein
MLCLAVFCRFSLARRVSPRNNFKEALIAGASFFWYGVYVLCSLGTFGLAFTPPCAPAHQSTLTNVPTSCAKTLVTLNRMICASSS